MQAYPSPDPIDGALTRLLRDLADAGVTIAMRPDIPDRLLHRPAIVPASMEERLRLHKPRLLALLAGGFTPADADAEYVFLERLGIADDLNMATGVGSPAWLLAVSEAMTVAQQPGYERGTGPPASPERDLHFPAR